jgi:tetratricopeptide (TPR) repeat protein
MKPHCISSLSVLVLSLIMPITALPGDTSIWQQSYDLEAAEQFDKAAALLSSPEALVQNEELAWLRIGWLNYRKGAYETAEAAYRQSLALNGESVDAHMGLMLTQLAREQWSNACQTGTHLLRQGDNYLAQLRMLVCEEGQHNWKALKARSQKITRRFPGEVDAWVYLARAQKQLGQDDASRRAYRQVLYLMPTHAEALAQTQVPERLTQTSRSR